MMPTVPEPQVVRMTAAEDGPFVYFNDSGEFVFVAEDVEFCVMVMPPSIPE